MGIPYRYRRITHTPFPMPVCYSASLNLVTPNELRGASIAFSSATAGLTGLAGGPLLVAVISDNFLDGPSSIGAAMAVLIAAFCPLASVLLGLGCRAMREAAVDAEHLD